MFKNSMRLVVMLSAVAIMIIAITAFSLWMLGTFGPIRQDIDRDINTHSNSFTQSTNLKLMSIMIDYNAIEIDIQKSVSELGFADPNLLAQQEALFNLMCSTKATMPTDQVAIDVLRFLNSKGGCK